MSRKQSEMVCISAENGRLAGIITDGDLRRALSRRADIYGMTVKEIMTANPFTIDSSAMAVQALQKMKENRISCLPVVDAEGKICGSIAMTQLVHAGLVL